MKKWIIALPWMMVVLSSCQNNHTHQLPPVAVPNQFYSMPKDYTKEDHLPYLAWWKTFHDGQLNHLINKGLSHNLDMKIALSRLEQSKGQLKQIQLSWIPTAQFFTGYSTNPAFGVPGAFYGVWAYYVVNIAKLINQQNLATFNVEYHRAMIDGVRLTVIGQIASAYFTLIAEKKQRQILLRLNQDAHRLTQLCRDDIHIGLRNNVDLAAFLIKEKYINAQIATTEHNIVLSQNALRLLVNENPGEIKSDRSFSRIDFSQLKPGSLPVSVLKNRPDIRMAASALKASKSALLMAYSDLFPVLQLDQFVGQASRAKSSVAQVTDAYPDWYLVPSTFGEISAQKGGYHAELNEYVKAIRRSLKEVDNAFSANKHYTDYFIATQRAEQDYRNKYHLQQSLLKAGLISYSALLESKMMYNELALLTNQAHLQQAMTLVLLYQDLAGGYKVKPEPHEQ